MRKEDFNVFLSTIILDHKPLLDYSKLSDFWLALAHGYDFHFKTQLVFMIAFRAFGTFPPPGGWERVFRVSAGLDPRNTHFCELLSDLHEVHGDVFLLGLLAETALETEIILQEVERRMTDKKIGQQFLLLDAGYGTLAELERLLRVDRIKSRRLDKYSEKDIKSQAIVKAYKLYREQGETALTIDGVSMTFLPDFLTLCYPEEKAVWAGLWQSFLRSLKKLYPMFTSDTEAIPEKVHSHLRDYFEIGNRREKILRGTDKFPTKGPEAWRADWDFRDASRQNRHDELGKELHLEHVHQPEESVLAKEKTELDRLNADLTYEIAIKRWGEKGKIFLDTLSEAQTVNVKDASIAAGVSRQMGHRYLKELKKALSPKK